MDLEHLRAGRLAARSKGRRRPRKLDGQHAFPGLGDEPEARGPQGCDPLSAVARVHGRSVGTAEHGRTVAGGVEKAKPAGAGIALQGDELASTMPIAPNPGGLKGRGGSSELRW